MWKKTNLHFRDTLISRGLKGGEHRFEAGGVVLAGGVGLQAVGPEGEGEGGEAFGFLEVDGEGLQGEEDGLQAGELKLAFEDFALRLL